MQLIDVIMHKEKLAKSMSHESFLEVEDKLDELEQALAAAKRLKRDFAEPIINKLFREFIDLRKQAFKREGRLTERLLGAKHFQAQTRDGSDIRLEDESLIDMQPRRTVELTDLRKAAEALGYLIMPMYLVDPRIYAESFDSVLAYWDWCLRHGLRAFLLAPPSAYSPQHQMRLFKGRTFTSEGCIDCPYEFFDLTPHQSGARVNLADAIMRGHAYKHKNQMLFLELLLNIYARPEIRSPLSLAATIFDRMDISVPEMIDAAHRSYLDYLVASGTKETDAIQIADGVIAPLHKERMKQKRLEEKARKLAEEAALRARDQDPIMFSIPKEVDLHTADYSAILGPCWGPDLPKELLALLMPIFGKGGSK